MYDLHFMMFGFIVELIFCFGWESIGSRCLLHVFGLRSWMLLDFAQCI